MPWEVLAAQPGSRGRAPEFDLGELVTYLNDAMLLARPCSYA
jgi:hypothetical protein